MKNTVIATILLCIFCGLAIAEDNYTVNTTQLHSIEVKLSESGMFNATQMNKFNDTVAMFANNTSDDEKANELINETTIILYNNTSSEVGNQTKSYIIDQISLAATNKTASELQNESVNQKIDTATQILYNKTASQLVNDTANDTKANINNYTNEQYNKVTSKNFLDNAWDILTGWGKQLCMYLKDAVKSSSSH